MADEKDDLSELEQVELKRSEKRKAAKSARDAQYLVDRKELDRLEDEHGFENVRWLDAPRFVDELVTGVVIKTPKPSHYSKFQDEISKATAKGDAQGKRKAQDSLGRSCIIYPPKEVLDRMIVEFPALLVSVCIEANKMGQLEADAEGKD